MTPKSNFVVFLLLMSLLKSLHGGTILMAGMQFSSHILSQVHVAEELVSRGHHVYLAIANRYPNLEAIEEKGIKILTYYVPPEEIYSVSAEFEVMYNKLIVENPGTLLTKEVEFARVLVSHQFNLMMNDSGFLEELGRRKFDISVVEHSILGSCYLILPKYLDIPFVVMIGTLVPWDVRIPALPSFYSLLTPFRSKDLKHFQNRFLGLLQYIGSQLGLAFKENTDLLRRYTNYSSWNEVVLESQLVLVRVDYIMDDIMPTMPHVIRVPGFSTSPVKPLPEDLKRIVSSARQGVVVMSFGGTAMYELQPSAILRFFDAFSQLNQTILVRTKVPEGIKIPQNIYVAKWFPQNDLLGHPTVKLFITHCGSNGQHEAIYHAVPMLGFPLFAEQARNCQKAVSRGFGLELNFHDFTVDQLVASIREILDNPKYAKTIGKYSQIMRSNPMTGRETAAYWIEHVMKFGGEHLRSVAMDMPLYQFLMVDILATIVTVLLLTVCVTYFTIKLLVRQVIKIFARKTHFDKVKQR